MASATRDHFSSRLGVLAATLGSAVGLGNIWKFPSLGGQNGGAAFLVVYLLASLCIGLPLMISDLSLGRAGRSNVISIFQKLAPRTGWWLIGLSAIISCLLIQLGCRHLHLHDRRYRRLCLILCGVWLFLGLVQGSLGVAIGVVCSQLLAGLAAAYGGKRSDLGKQSLQHILGLRRYLRSVPREQLQHIVQTNPDYFYAMAPYALALGVEKQFARRFGDLNLPECSYLAAGISTRLSPTEWMGLLQDVAEALDERQRQLFWEKLMGK